MSRAAGRLAATVAICLAPAAARAHSFGTTYVLPVPVWMYAWGGAATLVLTFLLLAWLARAPALADANAAPGKARQARRLGPAVTAALHALGALCLVATIATGLFGTGSAADNLGMTLFWVIFLLGLTYLVVLAGNLYAVLNPWALMLAGLARLGLDLDRPRLAWPGWLATWPAFLLYVGLIWLELFGGAAPRLLGWGLLGYSALTLAGAFLFGRAAWFARGDVFAVFFRMAALLAPVEIGRDGRGWTFAFRPPLSGALAGRADGLTLVLFVLFMLSSTTYDGIYETQLWISLYWANAMSWLQPLWGDDLGLAQQMLMGSYLAYRQIGLLLSPFAYFLLYAAVLWLAKLLARSDRPLRALLLDFAFSLIPIAIAYNFTHYFIFLLTQLANLPRLLSDPFGTGWSLLGIAGGQRQPLLPMPLIWHTQVAVLLLGHVASVWLGHQTARRVFARRWQVNASQLPLLALMVFYTMLGIWILSLPLMAGGD